MSVDASGGLRVLLTPSMLGLHVFAVAAVALTVVMGGWQWESYQDRQAADEAAMRSADPVPLHDLMGPDDPLTGDVDGRTVSIEGRFARSDQQLVVADRPDGTYWVVRPFLVADSAVLVVLGSVDDPESAASVDTGTDPTRITGVVQPSEPGTDRPEAGVVDDLNTAVLVGELPTDLYSAYLVRTYDSAPPGLTPVEPAYPDTSWSSGLRNLMYALQWWLFGAFAVFMWGRMCGDRVRRARAARPEPETAPVA